MILPPCGTELIEILSCAPCEFYYGIKVIRRQSAFAMMATVALWRSISELEFFEMRAVPRVPETVSQRMGFV